MAIANLYPAIAPALLLDFANVKALDPRVSFSRASTARYYNGVTVAKAEENLLQYSEQFDNSYWTKVAATVTANAVTAPDGTSTADMLVETAATSGHVIQRAALATGVTYTLSCYIKAAGRAYAFLADGSSNGVSVDLTTGAVSTAVGSVSNAASVESPAGSGWWRVSFTVTAASTFFNIYASTDGVFANRSYAGDVTQGIYLWGAQLEQRSAVTAYTATTTQPITNYIPVLLTANNNVARFDHNPTTGESLGLLVEEQRTNLLTYSEEFDNAAWTPTGVVSANVAVAPDGMLTADLLSENTTTSDFRLARGFTATVGVSYALSVYAKARPGSAQRYLQLVFNAGFSGTVGANFNLVTGAVGTTSGSLSATITSVGNGWYRCAIVPTNTAASTSPTFRLRLANVDTSANITGPTSYAGDGWSGILLFGAQLEAGAFATSYIPTTSASATRSADAASISTQLGWFNTSAGTVYVDGYFVGSTLGQLFGHFTNNTNRSGFGRVSTNRTRFLIQPNNSAAQTSGELNDSISGFAFNQNNKLIGSYQNQTAVTVGANGFTNTAGDTQTGGWTLPNDVIQFAAIVSGAQANGYFKKIAYYPAKLTSAQLQALTS
jgi:hypothetical protein